MPKRTNDGLKKRCACGRKKWTKCRHPWHFGFHYGGREHRYSLTQIAKMRGERSPATKGDAVIWRERLCAEIRNGTDPEQPASAPSADLTVGDVMDRYLTEFVGKHVTDTGTEWTGQHLRPASALQADYALRIARACDVPAAGGQAIRFEQKPLGSVTKADIEAIRARRRPCGVVGCNRLLARLRHVFNWAIEHGYVTHTPFKREGVTVVKLDMRAEAPRTRRLEPGEKDRLMAHANPHLRALIEAALATGCRVGELLSLQWQQVRADAEGGPRWLVLPARKTKTNTDRTLPIGSRLRAELAMRRHAADGQPHPPEAYVFGDETGARVGSIKKAWELTVLRAHGHTPQWVKGKPGQLAAEARAALRSINLHFHDLRREFACTLLESSAGLHDVSDFLGHANITTTSRYTRSSPMRLADALARLEGADAAPPAENGAIRTPSAHDTAQPDATPSKSLN